ncbi:MAG: hypothetical protein M1540_00330 [Candidatus Bathyarchaeota archaeon]|nr:hypothetical protein [Candidatus Bathyarchaeota archaeon]
MNDKPPGIRDIWVGFNGKREIRTPRIEPLYSKSYLKKCEVLGFDVIIFDLKSSLAWLKKGTGRAIFHISFLKEYFPSLLESEGYLNSAEYGRLINEKTEIGQKLARNHLSPTERRKVIQEFDGKCHVCKSTENLTIHHILDSNLVAERKCKIAFFFVESVMIKYIAR